jgi:hypothetical protein
LIATLIFVTLSSLVSVSSKALKSRDKTGDRRSLALIEIALSGSSSEYPANDSSDRLAVAPSAG